jgi:transcription elongation factor GreA
MNNQNYLTQEGLDKLTEELEQLKSIKRPEIVKKIEIARGFGDLSENAAYHDAREEQSFLEGRILELQDLIKKAIVVDTHKSHKGVIAIGSKVKILLNGDSNEFEIVGATESDPLKGLISYISPLGESLMNKKIGDEFEVNAPKGVLKCKILEIK